VPTRTFGSPKHHNYCSRIVCGFAMPVRICNLSTRSIILQLAPLLWKRQQHSQHLVSQRHPHPIFCLKMLLLPLTRLFPKCIFGPGFSRIPHPSQFLPRTLDNSVMLAIVRHFFIWRLSNYVRASTDRTSVGISQPSLQTACVKNVCPACSIGTNFHK